MAMVLVGCVFLMVSRITVDSVVVSFADASIRMGSIKVNTTLPVVVCVCVREGGRDGGGMRGDVIDRTI